MAKKARRAKRAVRRAKRRPYRRTGAGNCFCTAYYVFGRWERHCRPTKKAARKVRSSFLKKGFRVKPVKRGFCKVRR